MSVCWWMRHWQIFTCVKYWIHCASSSSSSWCRRHRLLRVLWNESGAGLGHIEGVGEGRAGLGSLSGCSLAWHVFREWRVAPYTRLPTCRCIMLGCVCLALRRWCNRPPCAAINVEPFPSHFTTIQFIILWLTKCTHISTLCRSLNTDWGYVFLMQLLWPKKKPDDDNEKFYSARCNYQLDRRFETFKFNTSAGKKNIV